MRGRRDDLNLDSGYYMENQKNLNMQGMLSVLFKIERPSGDKLITITVN